MVDLVERLIVFRDVSCPPAARDLIADAANKITSLEKRNDELLRQVQVINPLAR